MAQSKGATCVRKSLPILGGYDPARLGRETSVRNVALLVATIAGTVVTIIAFLDVEGIPHSFYTLVRMVIFAAAVVGVVTAVGWRRRGWICVFGVACIVFNPLLPLEALGLRERSETLTLFSGATLVLLWIASFTMGPHAMSDSAAEDHRER